MTSPVPVPVIDLAAATADDPPRELLDQVKEATETVGVIQVVNHGIPSELISEFDQRIGRLLALPRDRKAELASPAGHPYRSSSRGRRPTTSRSPSGTWSRTAWRTTSRYSAGLPRSPRGARASRTSPNSRRTRPAAEG
jgi:isopenicillin N synthase-like dioxygenase